jgi:4a-hydroxytetrahydrobiopterin dehydratase
MGLLAVEEIYSHLPDGWSFDANSNSIWREFEQENFLDAIGFMNMIAPLAEIQDHHPDLFLHSYKKVTVTLSSHDKGGVTERDIKLATEINAL